MDFTFVRHSSHRALRVRRMLLAGLTALAAAVPLGAQAQGTDWPSRPVTVINPFAVGSAVDVVVRVITSRMAVNLNQGIVVENRTGASGNIGTEAAARAKPDGYTLLAGSPGTMAINPFLFAKLPYDAVKDFVPVSHMVSFPQIVVANPKGAIKSIPDLIAAARARPGAISHASSGPGSTSHLVMELIKADANLKMIHVGYRGGSPAMQAVMAGDVQTGVEGIPSLMGLIKAGSILPLAVTSAKRSPLLPNIPAMSEYIPNFDAEAWVILMAPANTPAAIVARISAEVKRAMQDSAVRQQLEAQGATIVGSNPAESLAFHQREMRKFERAVKLSGAKVE